MFSIYKLGYLLIQLITVESMLKFADTINSLLKSEGRNGDL